MIHFSVDDTIAIFENLTKGEYTSCFEEPTLLFLKKLNEQYGLKVSLYCFFESNSGFCLSEATSKFKDEFKENNHWLRFGFHAFNRESKYDDYEAEKFILEAEKVYDNLYRIVSSDAVVYDVRLGFAKGNINCIKAFKNKYSLFQTLYGVDDNRIEYYLSQEENDILLDNGTFYESRAGINIKLSELRIEKQTDMVEYMKKMPPREYYAFFTHEQFFGDEKTRKRIIQLCEFADGFTF